MLAGGRCGVGGNAFFYYSFFITRSDGNWLRDTDSFDARFEYTKKHRLLRPAALLTEYFDASERQSGEDEQTVHVLAAMGVQRSITMIQKSASE